MSFWEKFFILLFFLSSVFFFLFLYTSDMILSLKIIIPIGIFGFLVIVVVNILESKRITLRKS